MAMVGSGSARGGLAGRAGSQDFGWMLRPRPADWPTQTEYGIGVQETRRRHPKIAEIAEDARPLAAPPQPLTHRGRRRQLLVYWVRDAHSGNEIFNRDSTSVRGIVRARQRNAIQQKWKEIALSGSSDLINQQIINVCGGALKFFFFRFGR